MEQFGERVVRQQLALRKAQNFVLRAGNSGRGHHLGRMQILQRAALAGGQFLSATDTVFPPCFWKLLL